MLDHISTFKEIVADLETMEVKYDEANLGLILLCSLPSSYSDFRNTILYNHETLTLDDVDESLCSKETMKQLVNGFEAKPEGLVARGRFHERGSRKSDKGRSNCKNRNKSCKYCKKKEHVIDECY